MASIVNILILNILADYALDPVLPLRTGSYKVFYISKSQNVRFFHFVQ